jgi:hypothetical protein
MQRSVLALIRVTVVAMGSLWLSVSVGAQRPVPQQVEAAEANALFDGSELHDIWLHINARDWEELRANYRENTYYPADIEWRGIKVRNVGIRSRGRTSRSDHKPGLQIDFNRYVGGQEFLGLKSLVLDNLWQDASMIRERLAMQVFRRMGLPAPRVSHARVFVKGDREYAGVYGVVEVIDKKFLARNFGEDGGYLYEYRWYDEYRFDYVRPDLEWYATRFEPKTHETNSTSELFQPIKDLIQTINNTEASTVESALQPYLDLRSYVIQIAIDNFLSEPDGLLGGLGMNNFYLYRFKGRSDSQLIVWDRDLSFERLNAPPPQHNFETNVLAAKIWEAPELRRLYLQTLVDVGDSIGPAPGLPYVGDPAERQCPAVFDETPCGWLEQEIFDEYAQIREAVLADPRKPYSNEDFEGTIEFLKQFARERADIVRTNVAVLAPELRVGSRPPNGSSPSLNRQSQRP